LSTAAAPLAPSTTTLPAPVAPPKKVLPGEALDAYTGDPNFMASLARGLTVIEAFTPQTPQMTISQLSLRTGLSRAAVRRWLYRRNTLSSDAAARSGGRNLVCISSMGMRGAWPLRLTVATTRPLPA